MAGLCRLAPILIIIHIERHFGPNGRGTLHRPDGVYLASFIRRASRRGGWKTKAFRGCHRSRDDAAAKTSISILRFLGNAAKEPPNGTSNPLKTHRRSRLPCGASKRITRLCQSAP